MHSKFYQRSLFHCFPLLPIYFVYFLSSSIDYSIGKSNHQSPPTR
ncbi:hypothetical protein BFG60_2957 [Microcystis aeruginosa NIES-98]|nr:hypothetical protein BFG60_2957 [Microcystis aeruginosa NIES-98]